MIEIHYNKFSDTTIVYVDVKRKMDTKIEAMEYAVKLLERAIIQEMKAKHG